MRTKLKPERTSPTSPAQPAPDSRDRRVGIGSHSSFISDDPEATAETSARFALRGLESGERILWIASDAALSRAIGAIGDRRENLERAISSGQILLCPSEDHLLGDGRFGRFRTLTFIEEECDRAARDGFPGLRVIHEIASTPDARRDYSGEISSYEAGLTGIVCRTPLEVLCVYHRSPISSPNLLHEADSNPLEPDGDPDPEGLGEPRLGHRHHEEKGALGELLRRIMDTEARRVSSPVVATDLLGMLGRYSSALAGRVLAIDPRSDYLIRIATWQGEGKKLPLELAREMGEIRIRKGEGLTGRAWEEQRLLWSTGKRTAGEESSAGDDQIQIALPVLSGNRVRMVFELFLSSPLDPDLIGDLDLIGWTVGRLVTSPDHDRDVLAEGKASRAAGTGATRAESRLLDAALQRVTEAVAVTTASFGGGGPSILYVNPAFTELTGYSEAEALGRSLRILTGPETDGERMEQVRSNLLSGKTVSTEIVGYRKDGTRFRMQWEIFPVTGPEGEIENFISIQRDVTSRRTTQEALRRANRDALTELLNREVFMKRLARAFERWKRRKDDPFAVLFLDLNGFKRINDTLGHAVGDQLLIQVARRLERTLRPGDTIARFGGDEFVILVEMIQDVRVPLAVAERIQEQFRNPLVIEDHEIRTSASVGICLGHSGHATIEDVIRDADAAMYRAKGEGRSHHLHEPETPDPSIQNEITPDEILRAIERDGLSLDYQPFVDLRTGQIVGLEALVRLNHPDRGRLGPQDFLAAAESAGLGDRIERWVLRSACRQLSEWRRKLAFARSLVLSVNHSGRALLDPDLAPELQAALEETGLEPASLQLEFPDGAFNLPAADVRAQLDRLATLGVRICVDDFGARHSTVAYLDSLPISTVKLDRAFLAQELEGDGLNSDLTISTVLELAGALGVEVVAKGVETAGHRDTLRHLGCPFAQGLLFGNPTDSLGTEALLSEAAPSPLRTTNGDGSPARQGWIDPISWPTLLPATTLTSKRNGP